MIACKELGQEFETKEQLFRALKENKNKIISIKKKTIYTGYNSINPEESKQVVLNNQTKLKSISKEASKGLFSDDKYYYFAVNTTKILDSHNDLHDDGIWTKSAKEQSGKNYLVDTHTLTIKDTIAYPEDVEIFVAKIPFSALGKDYEGETEALVYKVLKSSIRDSKIKKDLEDGKSMQASVKMQYVNVELAMNSKDEEDEAELKTYNDNKHKIANIKDFKEEINYFFLIKEAKNIHESSLVPFGSNSVTGRIKEEDKQAEKSLETNEAEKSLQLKQLLTQIKI